MDTEIAMALIQESDEQAAQSRKDGSGLKCIEETGDRASMQRENQYA